MSSTIEASIPVGERITTLDILRGCALLGILIMNMPGFSTSFFAEADGSHLWPGAVDQFAENARDMLFSGKFNSMFSLLFGIGFTIQFARMERRDPAGASALYLRRLAVLAFVGIAHATLFWPGDVLHIYAMLGLLLVFPLRRARPRTIVLLIIACLLYPVVSGALRLMVTTPEITAMLVARAQALEAADNVAYGNGSFVDAARQHALTMKYFYDNGWSLWGTLGFWVQMALTMLIGLLAGRLQWVQRVPELMPQIRRLMWVALGIGLACGAAFTLIFHFNRAPGPSPIKFVGSLCYWTSRPALMIFYVLVIVRLAQDPVWARRLAPLASTGRMPLTNYLMQTAICTTIFYAWGFGLWGKVGPAWGLVLAFAIFFAIQVPWSRWWLARHERGPLEALWARVTYGEAPRRAAVAAD
jgi:uncharacterized protein